jgi:hypothetical protein
MHPLELYLCSIGHSELACTNRHLPHASTDRQWDNVCEGWVTVESREIRKVEVNFRVAY